MTKETMNSLEIDRLKKAGWSCDVWGPGGGRARENWTHPVYTPPDRGGYMTCIRRGEALRMQIVAERALAARSHDGLEWNATKFVQDLMSETQQALQLPTATERMEQGMRLALKYINALEGAKR